MDYFLKQLAQKKHELYMKIHKGPAYRKDDCLHRVLDTEKYETVLEVVNMLGPQESLRLCEIEREQYPDAPYVS
jgi:hypothetical protein